MEGQLQLGSQTTIRVKPKLIRHTPAPFRELEQPLQIGPCELESLKERYMKGLRMLPSNYVTILH